MNYLYQLVQSIKYCHSRNIIHMDIKTNNILITENNRLKLGDFGLSSYNKLNAFAVGTGCYLAPELWLSTGNKISYEKSMDIWCLGCVIYEIFSLKSLRRRKIPIGKQILDDENIINRLT